MRVVEQLLPKHVRVGRANVQTGDQRLKVTARQPVRHWRTTMQTYRHRSGAQHRKVTQCQLHQTQAHRLHRANRKKTTPAPRTATCHLVVKHFNLFQVHRHRLGVIGQNRSTYRLLCIVDNVGHLIQKRFTRASLLHLGKSDQVGGIAATIAPTGLLQPLWQQALVLHPGLASILGTDLDQRSGIIQALHQLRDGSAITPSHRLGNVVDQTHLLLEQQLGLGLEH
ncbi:hypothetical protein D3C77_226850 [compost metagenome]